MNNQGMSKAKNGEVSGNGFELDSHAYEHSLGTLSDAQMKEVSRLEFSAKTKRVLAARVGYRCSNPNCKVTSTIGPGDGPEEVVVLGEAAHIIGAIQDGEDRLSPRADSSKKPEEIKSVGNGIWLCRNCHKLVDAKDSLYTAETLRGWKKEAERRQAQLLEEQPSSFVENYFWPSIELDKGILAERFKDKEWCLLAYMMDTQNNSKRGLSFEPGEDDFLSGYQSWMSSHSIRASRSGLDFSGDPEDFASRLKEIVDALTGLVKMDECGLDYGECFEEFTEKLYETDENGLEKLIQRLSCIKR